MTPHRRKDSPYWQVSPRVVLPGRGRIRLPSRSSGSKSKAMAMAMSRTLAELPLMGFADILERYLMDPSLSPAEIHAAKLGGTLHTLRAGFDDPALYPLLESFQLPDPPSDHALSLLPDLIDSVRKRRGERGGPRLSWLLVSSNVQAVLEAKETMGRKRNSVYRCERRAIMEFLTTQVGTARRVEIMREVRFPRQDDTRHVFLRPTEIEDLTANCMGPLFRCLVTLALGSGVDRGPLLRIRPRHFEDPVLQIQDTKTDARFRTLRLGPVAASALRKAITLTVSRPDGRVFPYTVAQVRHRFDAAVRRAGLDSIVLPGGEITRLRFKDLRGVFATYYLKAGGSPRELQRILGHARIETTLRYVKSLPIEEAAKMAEVERIQGLALLGIERTA